MLVLLPTPAQITARSRKIRYSISSVCFVKIVHCQLYTPHQRKEWHIELWLNVLPVAQPYNTRMICETINNMCPSGLEIPIKLFN